MQFFQFLAGICIYIVLYYTIYGVIDVIDSISTKCMSKHIPERSKEIITVCATITFFCALLYYA